MKESRLELYWSEIPIGKENSVVYHDLCAAWNADERRVRQILHMLSTYDNGDDYILIRSAKERGGFYRTDDKAEMEYYRRECLKKGKSIFAPVKKINRVLRNNDTQVNIENNLRLVRCDRGIMQKDVVDAMRQIDTNFDIPLLSKMENGVCLPTPIQLAKLAEIYECEPSDLLNSDFYM